MSHLPTHRMLKQNPWEVDLLTSWSGRLSNPTWPERDKFRSSSFWNVRGETFENPWQHPLGTPPSPVLSSWHMAACAKPGGLLLPLTCFCPCADSSPYPLVHHWARCTQDQVWETPAVSPEVLIISNSLITSSILGRVVVPSSLEWSLGFIHRGSTYPEEPRTDSSYLG